MALLMRLISSPWLLLAGALALSGSGFAAGQAWRGLRDAAQVAQTQTAMAQCQASHQKARADGAEAAAAALTVAAGRVRLATDRLARQEADARAANDQFREELSHVPETYLCGTSAAERAYRRSVQRAPD